MLGRIFTAAALVAGGVWLNKRIKSGQGFMGMGAGGFGSHAMSSVEESIEIDVPLSTAYNQFTQFEEFPQFMSTVHEVRQIDDTHLHWRADVAGKEKEWDSVITHQIPDKRIAWRSTSGVPNAGDVSFERVSDSRTRIRLKMSYQPETFGEQALDAIGAVRLQAKQNLSTFKEMLESRGHETGAWRGKVGGAGTSATAH